MNDTFIITNGGLPSYHISPGSFDIGGGSSNGPPDFHSEYDI